MTGRWWSLFVAISASVLVTTQSALLPNLPFPTDFPDIFDGKDNLLSQFDIGDVPDDLFCTGGFPRREENRLNTRDKLMKFKDKIRDTAAKQVFQNLMAENPIIDFSTLAAEDVRDLLESIVDDGGDLLQDILDLGDPTKGEAFKNLVDFVVHHPDAMRMFKKPAVEHVLSNLTLEYLEELCDNLDHSDLSETSMLEIFKDFPQCVGLAQKHLQEDSGEGNIYFQHGRAILDRLRSSGIKLNVTDFLLDPWHVTVEDINGLRDSDLRDLASLQIIDKIVHELDENVMTRLGERVAEVIGEPSDWSPQLIKIIARLISYLPDEFLQEHIDDNLLEVFLEGDFMLSKKVASFMVESLYDKRNAPSFNKRFCLSIYHHPYITVSMLEDFTSLELWHALKECPRLFYQMAYSSVDMLMADGYYGDMRGYGEEEHDDYFHSEWDPEYLEHIYREKPMERFLEEMQPDVMQLRPLLRRIFSDRNITLNETQLFEFAIFLPAAPAHVFNNLSPNVLKKVWPKLQRFGKYPVQTLQVVSKKIFKGGKDLDGSVMHLLGQALAVIPCGAIHEFPDSEFPLLVLSSYFKENNHFSCEINEAVCRVIAKKALRGTPTKLRKLVMDNLGKLGRFLEIDDFDHDEIFFNEFLPDHVERDMFKRKDKEERQKIGDDGFFKFNTTDDERVLDAFVKEGKENRKKTKMGYKDALLVKKMERLLKETPFSELDFTEEYGNDLPKLFNISYLGDIDFNDGEQEFSLRRFGDIEEFLNRMFDTSFEDIVNEMIAGKLDVDDLDVFGDHSFFLADEDFLEEIPENEESLQFLESMKNNLKKKAGGSSVGQKELSSGFKVIKDMLQMDGNTTDICLDDTTIDSLDCYFTRARKFELEKLSNKTRKSILVAEGKSDECVASMSPDEIQEHFESLLGVDEELSMAEIWGEDLLMRIGPAILCGMDASHVTRLTPRAAVRFSDRLCQCRQLSNEARKAVFGKIKEFYNNDISNMFKPPYNMDVASCLMYAPSGELKGMTRKAKKIFVAMGSRVLDEIHHHLDMVRDMGYLGVEDLVDETISAQDLASTVWAIMDELDVPAMDRFSHLSQFKSVINVDFLNELSDVEFEEAVDYLQDFDDWTDGQKGALAVKIEESFGDIANWTGNDIRRLGGLLSAKLDSDADFGKIDLDECAMDYILERFSDNEDLFEGICEKMTVQNAIETIEKKPQALCCVNKDDARTLNATFILKALSVMGSECHPCMKKKGELIKELARTMADYVQKMPNNDTTKEFFEDLKCVAGKMPAEFLEKLPTDRFERFDRDAIEAMDPEVFCKVAKKDVLKRASSVQIEAIDDAKLGCLDIEQFEAFWEVVDGSETDEYRYDDDEVFPDFSVTKIGDSHEFSRFLSDFSGPMTQIGSDNQNVQCVSPKGANVKDITEDGKRKLRKTLSGDELDLFNSLDYDSNIDFSGFSEADIVGVLEEMQDAFEDMPLNFTQFLFELPTMVADPSVSNYDEVLEDAFEHLIPKMYLMIEPSLMCDSVKQLKKKHLEKLCGRMLEDDVSTHTFLTINTNCPVCFTYWIKERKDERLYDMLDEQMAAAFYAMRLRQNKPLDIDILALGPRGITPDIIKAVDPKSFGSVSQLAVLSHPKVAKQIPKKTIKFILQKIVGALGPIKQWNKMLKSRLQFFLLHLPRKDLLDQLSPSDVIQMVTSREGETEGLDDPEIRKILGQVVSRYVVQKSSSMDKDILEKPEVFCLLLSSGMPRKLLNPKTSPYTPEFLLEMAYECSQFYDISQSAGRKFFRAILNDVTEDEVNLNKMKDVLRLLPTKDIEKFPKDALSDMWKDVKDQKFDEFQLRVFWDAVKADIKTLDCDSFKKLGQLLRVVPRSLLDNSDLLPCLDDVMDAVERDDEMELPKTLNRGLWTMVKSKLKAKSIKVSDYMLDTDFPVQAASIIPKSEYNSLSWDLTDKDIRETAFEIAEYVGDKKSDLISNMFRDLDLDDPEIQEHVLENDDVAKVVFSFMDDDALGRLPSGDTEGSMLEELAGDVEHMSTRSLEKNVALMKKRIDLKDDCQKETVCLDEGQARVLGPLFVGIRPSEIECFTQTTRKVIIESIGQNKNLCKRMTAAVIQKLLSLVNPSQAIQAGEDLDAMYGCMICGFTKAQIQGLSDDQVVLLQDTLSGCHQFEKDVKDVIMDKIYRHFGGFSNYLEANPDVGIGTLIMSVDVNEITSLDDDTLEYIVASLGDITSELKDELADLKERIDRREITAAKYDDYFKTVNQVLSALYDMITPTSPTTRRKRAVSNSDEECDILSTFNGNLCFLSEVQVNSLSDQAVADCASEFQECDYSDDIFATLATKAKTALGATADWETNHYASLGKLLGHMGDSTISEMELTDDVMDVIPKVYIENGDDLFNQYLTHNSKSIGDLTGENVADYALLLGDLEDEDLNDLEPSAVAEAVTTYDLGGNDLSALDDDVVELFTNKLIESDTFSFTDASAGDISTLGLLAGKLPENVLSELSTEQKSGISADALQLIEPDVLASSFTQSDFAALTSDQANALSGDQLDELSDDQRNTVSGIATTTLDDDSPDGHASTISTSFGMLVTLVIASIWTLRLE